MKSMLGQFRDFAASKPADETYPYYAIQGCAVYQFLKASGYPVFCAGGAGNWIDTDFRDRRIEGVSFAVLAEYPHTWGALTKRLSVPGDPA